MPTTTHDKTCAFCGKAFVTTDVRGKFCSRECYGDQQRGKDRSGIGGPGAPGTCELCGAAFVNRGASYTKRFCSLDCYHKSNRGKVPNIPPSCLGAGGWQWARGLKQTRQHVQKRVEAMQRTLAATVRECVECHESFTPTTNQQRYCSGRCSEARRKRSRGPYVRFKIPKAAYDRLFERQGGKCKICGHESGSNGRGDRLCVDHIHGSDRVRGLLCHRCNTAIGLFRDDRELLTQARSYLGRLGRTVSQETREKMSASHRVTKAT